jgi:hypothetical protein
LNQDPTVIDVYLGTSRLERLQAVIASREGGRRWGSFASSFNSLRRLSRHRRRNAEISLQVEEGSLVISSDRTAGRHFARGSASGCVVPRIA